MNVTALPVTNALPPAEKIAWLRLMRTENIGPVTFYGLLRKYGSASEALRALPEIAQAASRKKPLALTPMDDALREIDALTKSGVQLIAACEAAYPLALAATEDAPPLLCVAGDVRFLNKPAIGIVGSRNASLNGRRFAEILARDLGRAEQVVVSGLARGIDTAAHIGALETGTVAVVAGGVDVVYPPENQKLYDAIRERGAVVAESPLGQQPFAASFPRRNRIISGLSSGVVVVEASQRSGSLITARMAGEQGRDVYAVPGHPLDPRAAGPNHLIREGATLVRDAADILESTNNYHGSYQGGGLSDQTQMPFPDIAPVAAPDAEHTRALLAEHIGFTPVGIDDLIRVCALPAGHVMAALLDMELSGAVIRLAGNRVVASTPP